MSIKKTLKSLSPSQISIFHKPAKLISRLIINENNKKSYCSFQLDKKSFFPKLELSLNK